MKHFTLERLKRANWPRAFWHFLFLLFLLLLALYMRVHDGKWIKQLRNLSFDSYNQIDPRPSSRQVVIVDIDEASLARPELGQWPWPRKVMAELVTRLDSAGAKAIVFDLVFAEQDRTSPHIIVRNLDGQLPDAISKVKDLPDYDQLLAQEIRKAGNVVTGFVWSADPESRRREPALKKPFILASKARSLYDSVPEIKRLTTNIPGISKAAAGNGNFGVRADIDGIIRKVPLIFSYSSEGGAQLYPSLSLEAYRVASDPKGLFKIQAPPQGELGVLDPPYRLIAGDRQIPLNQNGLFHVHYAPLDPAAYISAYRVLEGGIDPKQFQDKIVFIATSAEGLKDIRSTPLDLQAPGVEVHRNIVEQILEGHFLIRPKLVEAMEIVVIALIGLLIIMLVPYTGTGVLALSTLLLIMIMGLLSWAAFQNYGILVDPVYPSLCLISLFILGSILSFRRVETERKHVRNAFGLYISRDYMRELTKNPEKLKLGGQTKNLTVMFSDIRDFTSIGERFTPNEMIRLMNDFLTPMSEKIMENKGTIDKYIGDAIMAFWNAPLDDPEHARHACNSAMDMKEVLGPVNEELVERMDEQGEGRVILRAGIGLATGPCAVGNMGSRDRFAYSALGDAVNLASRLEALTKTYQVTILIDRKTHQKIPDMATLELDKIRVAGRQAPERIYTVLGRQGLSDSPDFLDLGICHENMLEAYYKRDFELALGWLDKSAAKSTLVPGAEMTMYYEMMRARLENFIRTPPSTNWDGVWQTSKSK